MATQPLTPIQLSFAVLKKDIRVIIELKKATFDAYDFQSVLSYIFTLEKYFS